MKTRWTHICTMKNKNQMQKYVYKWVKPRNVNSLKVDKMARENEIWF